MPGQQPVERAAADVIRDGRDALARMSHSLEVLEMQLEHHLAVETEIATALAKILEAAEDDGTALAPELVDELARQLEADLQAVQRELERAHSLFALSPHVSHTASMLNTQAMAVELQAVRLSACTTRRRLLDLARVQSEREARRSAL